ncbi:MAG: GRP family sugar transporter [Micrococcaceae bacterium]
MYKQAVIMLAFDEICYRGYFVVPQATGIDGLPAFWLQVIGMIIVVLFLFSGF